MTNYRRINHRPAHPKIFVFSHTERAEIEYFQDFKQDLQTPLLVPRKILCREPDELLTKVIDWKTTKDNYNEEDGDAVWCIFDVDDFYTKNPELLIKSVVRAEKSGIKIAYANECFELWILLHFDAPTSSIRRGFDLTKKIQSYFKKYKLGEFKKNQHVFQKLKPFQTDAIANSKKIFYPYSKQSWHKKLENSGNPSTNIHLLVEEIIAKF